MCLKMREMMTDAATDKAATFAIMDAAVLVN